MKKILLAVILLQSLATFGQNVPFSSLTVYTGSADSARLVGIIRAGNAWTNRTFYGIDLVKGRIAYSDTAAMLSVYGRAFNYFTKAQADARYLQSFTESDPVWSAAAANYFTKTQSDARYLQSFTETDPVWTAASASYYTKTQSDARYLQSFTETDPVFAASAAAGIAPLDITHWNQAYNKYVTAGSYSAGTLTFTARDGTTAFTVAGLPTGSGSAYTFTNGLTENPAGTVNNDLITGKAGGLTVKGGTANSENLTLTSTGGATKGKIYLGASQLNWYDETNKNFTLGPTTTFSQTGIINIGVPASTIGIQMRQTSASAFSYFDFFDNSNAAVFRLNELGELRMNGMITLGPSVTTGQMDVGIKRSAVGTMEVNTGTAGTLATLKASTLNASTNVVFGALGTLNVSSNYNYYANNSTLSASGHKFWVNSGGTLALQIDKDLSFTVPGVALTSDGNKILYADATGKFFRGTVDPASIATGSSLSGMVKGSGVALSNATAGTDYSAGTSSLATGILKSTATTGALSIAVAADFPTLNQNTTGTAVNITGVLNAGSFPALSGDVTNTAGSLSTTVGAIKGASVPALAAGFLKYTGAAWTFDNSTYLTANQSISFAPAAGGDVTGSAAGPTSIVPTLSIGAGKVTNTMLAGSIAFSKLVGSDITLPESQITNLTTDLAAKQPITTVATGLTAAGTNQSTALALTGSNSVQEITTAASGTGVKLPTASTTSSVTVVNRGANSITVFPASSGVINGQSANAGYVVPAGSSAVFLGKDGTSWYTENAFAGGDVATSDGSAALILPTVNSNVGTFNNVTVNGKGQVTAASNVAYLTAVTGTNLDNIFSSNGLLKRTGAGTYTVDASTYLTANQTISWASTGDVTGAASGANNLAPVLSIGANKVLSTMMRQGVATSVIGVTGNATANEADIQASVDGQVLSRKASALGFNAIGGQAAITAASAAINTTETIVSSYIIPANTMVAGTTYRVTLYGTCTSTVANASNFRLRLGTAGTTGDAAVAVVTPTAATSGTTVPFKCNLFVTIRSTGSGTGTTAGGGDLNNNGVTGISAAADVIGSITTTSALNTTAQNTLSVTYVSAATTTTSTFQLATIEIVKM